MSSARPLTMAAAIAILSVPVARAADLPPMPPPLPMVQEYSGWYLRGDIGFSNQQVNRLFNVLYNSPGTQVTNISKGFDSAPLFGVGVGYQVNTWFRTDMTGEYRGKANFRGLDVYSTGGGPIVGSDDYYGSKSEWLFLANAYFDLGTWWCLTPFVGAGVGFSRNTIHDFRDVNVPTLGVAYGQDASKWNFAWALHAGLAYKVNPNFIVGLAYRYVNLGDGLSGDLITYTGVSTVYNPMEFHGLTSQDIRLGVRWMLDTPEPVAYAPLISKG